MNLKNTLEEIGIFEINLQLEKYLNNENLLSEISCEIPVPSRCSTKSIIDNSLSKIVLLNKRNIFLLSNEIAFIEELVLFKNKFDNVIVGLSRNLSYEQVKNIKNNVPKGINVSFVNELEYPTILKPKDSIILVFGYMSGNNCLVLDNTYRMLEIYKSFLGKKIFINCIDRDINIRPNGFISINGKNYFDKII